MRLTLRIAAAALLGIAPFAPGLVGVVAAGSTYSRIDDEGVTHLTDAPTDPRFRRVSGVSGTANGWLAVPQAARGTRWGQEIQEISVDGEIAVAAGDLPATHGDPIDRLLVATALVRGITLMTADDVLLQWQLRGYRAQDSTE